MRQDAAPCCAVLSASAVSRSCRLRRRSWAESRDSGEEGEEEDLVRALKGDTEDIASPLKEEMEGEGLGVGVKEEGRGAWGGESG